MRSPTNIVELRKLLAEKFPGVRMGVGSTAPEKSCWTTGVTKFDFLLGGGLARGEMTELVTPGVACGSATFLARLFREAHTQGQWAALIDSVDSFDPSTLENEELRRLLWVRCQNAAQALKAADILLRDGNMPLVALDLASSPSIQLRKIPSSTWHRLLRIIETTGVTFLVVTPAPMIGCHVTRVFLDQPFTLAALEQPVEDLLTQFKPRRAENRAWEEREARTA